MFIAYDENQKRISIENAYKKETYYCPVCSEKLRIKAASSANIRTHFAHIRKCTDDYSPDMSEWHYNWQLMFPEECREIPLEKDGEKHRADILINNTVIEFQHSPIKSDEINRRNEFYTSLGYNMVWVFDANDKIRNIFDDSSIDPCICGYDTLCWKRKTPHFKVKMSSKIKFFLQYKTEVSNKNYKGIKFDILILLTELSENYLSFHPTGNQYITPANFLKEFGGFASDDTMSISEILSNSKNK